MDSNKNKIEGLGDIIQKLTKAVKIPTCSKCEERRKKLNKMFPVKKDQTSAKKSDPN
jgi:hypothetical protein|tara:strand:+ start:496 stop:666 length:171 start_codon:yes stop_codon:yes gene_type:complete